MQLEAKVVYVQLEGGFWGLEDAEGNKFLAINFPEQLKQEGQTFKLYYTPIEGMMSFAQWGTLIEITGFKF